MILYVLSLAGLSDKLVSHRLMVIDVYESIKTVFVLSRKLEVEKTECGFDAIQLMLYKYEFQSPAIGKRS